MATTTKEKPVSDLAYSVELESRIDISEFAQLLVEFLDQAESEDKKCFCEIWVER